MTERIDEKDLPLAEASPTAYIRAVQNGRSVRLVLPDLENVATIATQVASQMEAAALGQLGASIERIEGATEQAIADVAAQADAVLSSLGYLPPVEFESGLSVESLRFTVVHDGVTYRPVAVPFVTTGTFVPSQWETVQGVTGSDLASDTGGAMVGFKQAGATAALRNMIAKAREVVTPEDFAGTAAEKINAATEIGNPVAAGLYEIDAPVLVYDNQLFTGNRSGRIKLANGASVTAMIQSASYSDEANYASSSYEYKFRTSIRDFVLDMNRNNGTSGDGIILTTLNGWFENIKIINVPATSAAVRATNKSEEGQEMTGKALVNWFTGISVENLPAEPAGIFYEMGEDYNGKCTDNVMAFCHGYAGHTALHIGSAMGWFLYANRFAQIDDGILTGHANRTRWVGNVVDDFGYGYDAEKTSFIGMDIGSCSATNFSNSVAALNDVMTRGHAGASKSYTCMRFGFGSGTGIVGKAVGLFGNVISAENVTSPVAIAQKNEAVNDGIGMIAHNLMSTDASTDHSFSRANTVQLRSPYVRVKDNINGKRKIDDRQNCHGWINENYNTGAYDFYATGRASNVSPGTASEVLKVHVGAGCTVAAKLEVMAVNAGGTVVGRREFDVLLRKHATDQLVGGTATGGNLQVLTNNESLRNITAMSLSLVLPASPASTDVVSLRMETSVAGSDAPTAISYHCVFRGVAKKPGNGVFDLVV